MRKTILWLFAIALVSRAIIALLQITYGIDNQVNLDWYLYGAFNPGFELYHDFYGYYVVQLANLSKGLIPYKDFGYSYPPLFLYLLYPFFKLGGQHLASIPIWLADAVTAPVIYLIVKHIVSEKIAIFAGLSYAISPFFLLYEGYLWYSSQPMTLFLLFALYFLLVKRPMIASIMIGVAILLKQEVIFILPIFFVWTAIYYRKDLLRGMSVIGAMVASVSIPFLLLAPRLYISDLSYGLYPAYPSGSSATNATSDPSTTASLATTSLSCQTFSDTWRSLVCNFGTFTYTDIKHTPGLSVLFSPAFLNSISLWLGIPLVCIICYYLFIFRHNFNGSILIISSATAMTIFVAIFDVEIHSIYRYYLVPVYALILISSYDRNSLLLAVFTPIVSLFLPSGSIQLIPPLACIIWILIASYNKEIAREKSESPNVLAGPPVFEMKVSS